MTLEEFYEATKDMPKNALIEYLCPHTRDGYEEVTSIRYNKPDNIIDIW